MFNKKTLIYGYKYINVMKNTIISPFNFLGDSKGIIHVGKHNKYNQKLIKLKLHLHKVEIEELGSNIINNY